MRVNTTPTGTIIPTVLSLSAGTHMKSTSMSIMGAMESLRFLETNTTQKGLYIQKFVDKRLLEKLDDELSEDEEDVIERKEQE